MCQGDKPNTGKFHSSYIRMNVCGSAYENGCVVDCHYCVNVTPFLVSFPDPSPKFRCACVEGGSGRSTYQGSTPEC